jgi:putative peptidoglycan lipid II flippase
MGIILFAISLVGVVAAPLVVAIYALGHRDDPALYDTTVLLTRIVFPYIFLMGVAAIAAGALQARKRFAAPAFAPVMLNVALIAAPFVFMPVAASLGWPPVAALGIGALVGGVLHVVFQMPALRAEGLLGAPRRGWGDANVRMALKLLVPLIAGLGVYQLNFVLSGHFTSFIPLGALSYL